MKSFKKIIAAIFTAFFVLSLSVYAFAFTGPTVELTMTNNSYTATISNLEAGKVYALFAIRSDVSSVEQMPTTPPTDFELETEKLTYFNTFIADSTGTGVIEEFAPINSIYWNAVYVSGGNLQEPEFLGYLEHPLEYGDVTGDGIVDQNDLLRLAKNFAGYEAEIDSTLSDVNGDGVVDGKDLLHLAKYFAGWDIELGA